MTSENRNCSPTDTPVYNMDLHIKILQGLQKTENKIIGSLQLCNPG